MNAVGRLGKTKPSFGRWYNIAAIFFILQAVGPFTIIDRMIYGESLTIVTGDPFTQVMSVIEILVALFLFWGGWKRAGTVTGGVKLLSLLVIMEGATCFSSIDPATSLRRTIVYGVFVIGIIGLANLTDEDEFIALFERVILASILASIAVIVLNPADGILPDGAWRGIFGNKNTLGQIAAAGVLVSLHGYRVEQRKRTYHLLNILLFLCTILFAKSATSLMTAMVFIGLSVFKKASVVLVAVVVLTLSIAPDTILGLLDKDATLTGRTELWHDAEMYIPDRWLFGWGFDAFWTSANPAATGISESLGWVVPNAHNTILEMMLEVGLVGTILFGAVLLWSIAVGLKCRRTPSSQLGLTILMCAAGAILMGATEDVLVDQSQIFVGLLFGMSLIGERSIRYWTWVQTRAPRSRRAELAKTDMRPELSPARQLHADSSLMEYGDVTGVAEFSQHNIDRR